MMIRIATVVLGLVASASTQAVQYKLEGADPNGGFGTYVIAIGDVTGDGFIDFAVGALRAAAGAGRVTVHCSRTGRVIHTMIGDNPGDGMASLSAVGDVDGDQVPDLMAGSTSGVTSSGATGYVRIFSGATGALIRGHDGADVGGQFGFSGAGADLNGDGYADVLIGARREDPAGRVDAGRVYVFSGFDGTPLYPALEGDAARDDFGQGVAIVGDINADSVDDFVVGAWQEAGATVGYARVFSGATGATIDTIFGAQSTAYFGTRVGGPGDVDGDAIPDIGVSSGWWNSAGGTNAGAVFVYSGADRSLLRGYYGDSTNQNAGLGNASSASIGDVNGDGIPDIYMGAFLAEPSGGQSASPDGKAQIFSGAADQTELFVAWGSEGSLFGVGAAGLGDLDGDGLADFAIGANAAGENGGGEVYVYASMGWATDRAPRDLALLDVDGDLDIDVVTANSGSHDVSVWPNQGDGTLGAPIEIELEACDYEPSAIAAADLDDDGAVDDVVVACAASNSVTRIVDLGTTPAVSTMAAGGNEPVAIAAGDLDPDGHDDVIVARRGAPFGGGGGIAVSLNGGAFLELTFTGAAQRVVAVALCDLDGSGDLDLAAIAHGAPDQILLFDGDGAGALSFVGSIALPTTGLASSLCCDDLDGDTRPDLAVLLPTLFPIPATLLRAYLYVPDGGLDPSDYAPSADLATGGTFGVDLACGEIDQVTGARDLIIVHAGPADVTALYGFDPVTASAQSSTILPAGTTPIAGALGDLNGDGFTDVVIANLDSNDVSVVTFGPPAIAERIGMGCPGTGGLVPSLDGIGVPSLGNAAFGVRLTDARPSAPVWVAFGAGVVTTPLSGGCEYYIGTSLGNSLRFANASGAQEFVFEVPNDPMLVGFGLVFQDAVFDPNGAFVSVLALSNGLRLQVGM